MDKEDMISVETLHEILLCDPVSGNLTWKTRRPEMFYGKHKEGSCKAWNARYAGHPALAYVSKGYKTGPIFNIQFRASRVVFAMTTGHWPKDQVDHEDHDKLNNAPDNLRDTDQFGNMKNGPMMKNNKSGHVGVSWYKATNRWRAAIMIKGKQITLGYYKDINDAVAAREKSSIEAGYHENHGS